MARGKTDQKLTGIGPGNQRGNRPPYFEGFRAEPGWPLAPGAPASEQRVRGPCCSAPSRGVSGRRAVRRCAPRVILAHEEKRGGALLDHELRSETEKPSFEPPFVPSADDHEVISSPRLLD